MLNPVVHVEIHCADATAQQQFYTSLFGWEINADNEWNYGLVQHREGGLGGGISPAMGDPPVARITFRVQVEDLQASLNRAVELGGAVAMPPSDVNAFGEQFSVAAFADPEGNHIGLYYQQPRETSESEASAPSAGCRQVCDFAIAAAIREIIPIVDPVVHCGIHCIDARAQHQFYASLFGWNINAENEWNYGLVQHRERGLGSGISPAMGVPSVARITFHVQVEDLQASLDSEGNFIGLYRQ